MVRSFWSAVVGDIVKAHWKKLLIGAVVVALLAVTAGPWIYIHWIKDPAPARLSINDVTTTSAGSPTGATSVGTTVGTTGSVVAAGNAWTIANGSQLGYRVVEVLFGQKTEGVGRTNKVTGSLTLDGATVPTATFTVDMKSLKSDDARRDRKFTGEIMNTDKFPTSTFTLTTPIDLGTVPADGKEITASATGDLTLRGVTKPVTFDVTAKRTGATIGVSGAIDVKFADYSIANPSNAAVTTEDHGLIEFALAFRQGS